jgi:nucleoside-diphosphate-sugar epimerase
MRPSLLIIGCGDVGLRVLKLLHTRWRIVALTSNPARIPELRAAGAKPRVGDLDEPATLWRLGRFDAVLHLAPPPSAGSEDSRTRHLLQALARAGAPRVLVYGSTTGVYGDCAGAWVDETRAVNPQTDRARRRVDAEAQLRTFGRRFGSDVSILRIPGIYAADREGGPRERLLRGTPVLAREDDVFTNHIHADDLARACALALWRGLPQRVVNACDFTDLRMGDYFDLAADLYGLPRPERISRVEMAGRTSPMSMTFMSESRRLSNRRLTQELGLALRYPHVQEGLLAPHL